MRSAYPWQSAELLLSQNLVCNHSSKLSEYPYGFLTMLSCPACKKLYNSIAKLFSFQTCTHAINTKEMDSGSAACIQF